MVANVLATRDSLYYAKLTYHPRDWLKVRKQEEKDENRNHNTHTQERRNEITFARGLSAAVIQGTNQKGSDMSGRPRTSWSTGNEKGLRRDRLGVFAKDFLPHADARYSSSN
ncbi:hypothetical protein CDAR_90981 [Caerostris darwini]|uniref:Uncharacterized protein n=1 Tax=Caerostris darwini TaxID=1538125 RepID=A0AAV4Q819_9ARAC|nr:hypothetical protein CDAR_90981 [Caerostris darwini]